MKRISAAEARQRLGSMLDEVYLQGTEYVIERDGRPAAVVISMETYERHFEARRQTFDRIEAVRQRLAEEIPSSELERLIGQASAEVRSEHEQ